MRCRSIDAVTRFLAFVHDLTDDETLRAALLPMLIFLRGGSFGIVIGGAIVRQCRLTFFSISRKPFTRHRAEFDA